MQGPGKGPPGGSVIRSLVVVVLGFTGGAASTLNWLSRETTVHYSSNALAGLDLHVAMVLGALVSVVLFLGLDAATRLAASSLDPESRRRFLRLDWLSWLPALLPFLGSTGIRFLPVSACLLLIVALKAVFYFLSLPGAARKGVFASQGWLSLLFLVSGFAAMIYQVVWQRTLFAVFGVNIESITIVVTIFMMGLGLGAMFGGWLSRRHPDRAPILFLCCEIGIGSFGVVSLPLIDWIGMLALTGSPYEVSLAVFGLLFLPTLLMGATLPILVAHLDRHLRNVGRSVGLLYCINTVGSAIACFLTVDVLFTLVGQQASVLVAAACNAAVGFLVWRFARRVARSGWTGPTETETPIPPGEPVSGSVRILALVLAAFAGYVSLSQEIVWMRVMSYMTGGSPAVFAHVLGFFLVGVAAGAWYGSRECSRGFPRWGSALRFTGGMFLASGAFYFLSIGLTATVHAWSWPVGQMAARLVVMAVAFSLGCVFPVLCHLYTRAGQEVGPPVSRIYMANILGSTAGPLLTGFVLFDQVSTPSIIQGLSAGTILVSIPFLASAPRSRWAGLLGAVAALSAVFLLGGPLYDNLFARLQFHEPSDGYEHLVEDRTGVVATRAGGPWGDRVYGGGVYDGRINTDPVVNSNWIDRCYMVAALHPAPRDVLVIGMSTASWTRVLANHESVRNLTVVEISPAYLELLRYYPEQGSVVDDPKTVIHIDDGRRWLRRNPSARFDAIVQNTTYHWRSNATNLVSEEYFRLCKDHLKEGGFLYVNTTGAEEVSRTLSRVFEHVVMVRNFAAASDRPFGMTTEQKRAGLRGFSVRGVPVFDPANPRYVAAMETLSQSRFEDVGDRLRASPGLASITDDNMWTEFKMDRWFSEGSSWPDLIHRLADE